MCQFRELEQATSSNNPYPARISIASRNFRLFLAFRGTTRALLFAPYIFYYMTEVRGMSATQYGALQMIYYWVVMATEVPSGVVADRLGRKWTLALGALVNGIGCWTFAVSYTFSVFAVGEVLFALGTALISGADSAMLYDSLAAEKRETEYARAESAGQVLWLGVTVIGMPLTDLLAIRDYGPEPAYWVTGALSFVGFIAAARMVEPPRRATSSAREITSAAIGDIVKVPGILRLILYSVGVFLLLRISIVSFYNPALEANRVPVHYYGTSLALVNVAGAVAAWKTVGFLARYGERAAMLAMPISCLVMFGGLMLFRIPAAALLFCIQGAIFGAYPLVTRAILNRLVRGADRRATVLSIESMACRVGMGLMALLAGWALDRYSLNLAMAITVLIACIPFVFLPLLKRAAPI
ncbi:MAG: MFS transporter [Planctomycetota bacterium]